MYKEAEKYLDSLSDETLDQISDPEDTIVSASDTQDETEVEDENDDEDVFKKPARRHSTGKSSSSSSRSGGRSSGAKATSGTDRGKGGAHKHSTAKTTARKTASLPKVTLPASTVPKRRAGNVRFSGLHTSSTSTTTTTTTTTTTARVSSASSASSQRSNASNDSEDQWTEKYAPIDIGEVAVHSGKISSVREWLQTYADPVNKDRAGGAMLVLSGPSGSGKTAVVRMLAQEMGLTILEWVNSVNPNSIIQRPNMPSEGRHRLETIDEEYIPVMEAFLKFFSRAQRFHPLTTLKSSIQSNQSHPTGQGISSSNGSALGSVPSLAKKNIILIEDLPPLSAFSSRKIFQEAISNFVNSRNSSAVLVIIVSDVFMKQSTELLFSSMSENRDPALTIRTLLPHSVLEKIDSAGKGCPRVKQIKFNPIAPTIMKRAIRKLVEKEFRTTHTYAPDAEEIDQAIEIHDGDIRAVINSLQFLCYLPAKSRRRYREKARLLEEEQQMLHDTEDKVIQGQDSSLGFFHAVAKVLYNRRDWTERVKFDRDVVRIPPQAWSQQRPPLLFNPEKDLIEKLPMEPDLYTLMLHQNYTRHMNKIEECQTAIEYLCIADQFSHSFGGSNYTQTIQMQPYMTSLAVRGLLFAPTSAGPAFSSGGGQKKHWWPEYFAMNRAMRSNDQMFAEVAADLAGEEAQGLSAGHISGPGFLPKCVIREELVPMLHKCMTMNPYMDVWNKLLRLNSKNFVRHTAGHFGKKVAAIRKEFGEGDEGFLEEITDSTPGTGGIEIIGDHTRALENRQGAGVGSSRDSRGKKLGPLVTHKNPPDDDPIKDFSD
ncbi:MAG: Rad17 cell cycle checkpoint protein-domain-containing protein [Benniella sp.]|nr:MAG: Rad17 cell cycle checkpoint protein-domain-containing protein [Benniella sp.]